MSYIPEELKLWTRLKYYAGAEWPEYYSAMVGQSRDSSALERSNFRSMLANLGGESESVLVIHEGHWAVGWVEWIAIHKDDEKSLRMADSIVQALSDYPVINEEDFSSLEQEEAEQVWSQCYSIEERIKYIRDNKSQFEFHDYSDLIGCIRGKYFAGYASDLLN